MTIPTPREIDVKIREIESALESGTGPDRIVRDNCMDALDGGWLQRLRRICWPHDGGTFDDALLDRLLPELDARARRLPR